MWYDFQSSCMRAANSCNVMVSNGDAFLVRGERCAAEELMCTTNTAPERRFNPLQQRAHGRARGALQLQAVVGSELEVLFSQAAQYVVKHACARIFLGLTEWGC